jgi:hypothetical protein
MGGLSGERGKQERVNVIEARCVQVLKCYNKIHYFVQLIILIFIIITPLWGMDLDHLSLCKFTLESPNDAFLRAYLHY